MSVIAIFRQLRPFEILEEVVQSIRLRVVPSPEKRDTRLLRASKDVGVFAVCYVLAFLIFRLDIPRHGAWFRYPTPSATAAWVALVLAIAGLVYFKKANSK
jgi:hypothetical protein